jgi:hypothetical protein
MGVALPPPVVVSIPEPETAAHPTRAPGAGGAEQPFEALDALDAEVEDTELGELEVDALDAVVDAPEGVPESSATRPPEPVDPQPIAAAAIAAARMGRKLRLRRIDPRSWVRSSSRVNAPAPRTDLALGAK